MAPTAALHTTGWNLIHGYHTQDDDVDDDDDDDDDADDDADDDDDDDADDDDDDDDCTVLSAERGGGGGLIDQVIFAFCVPCLHSCLLVGEKKRKLIIFLV